MKRRSNQRAGSILLGALLLVSPIIRAESTAEPEEKQAGPRHRLDFTAVFLDSVSSDSLNGLLAYTYNLTGKSNLNLSVPYVDPDLGAGGDDGIGDMVVAYSIVPSARISANPWVPRTVGSGLAISMPTGSAKDGRSLDTWVVYPYLGLVLPLSQRIYFSPQVGYIHSVSQTASGTDLRLVSIETGLSLVTLNGFWASYFPKFLRDLKADDWAINHRLSAGKQLSSRFGISLDYTFVERFSFGSDIPVADGSDGLWEANLHVTF